MKKKVWLLSILAGLSLIVGACAPMKSAQDESYEMPAEAPSYDMERAYEESESMVEVEDSAPGGGSVGDVMVDRMVIYNADMSIAVEDPDAAMQAIIDMAEEAGGFVVYSNLYKTTTSSGATIPRASLTVRVPAGDLDGFISEIRGLTPEPDEDVLSENVSGQDVTAEYTDLSARLRNLEAAESALAALMEEAEDPEDVLAIFDELTYYRGEIEIVKGRMQYLAESAALSAISVEIVAKESLQPIEIAGWTPKGTAKRAVESLIDTLQFLGDALIWFGIYCLPFLIPLGVGVFFLVKLIKKRRQQKKARKMEMKKKAPAREEPEA